VQVASSSGSFALERRAQDDSKNKQRRRTDNGKGQYGDSGCARMTTRERAGLAVDRPIANRLRWMRHPA